MNKLECFLAYFGKESCTCDDSNDGDEDGYFDDGCINENSVINYYNLKQFNTHNTLNNYYLILNYKLKLYGYNVRSANKNILITS